VLLFWLAAASRACRLPAACVRDWFERARVSFGFALATAASPCLASLLLPCLASLLLLSSLLFAAKICADRTDFIIFSNVNNYNITNADINLSDNECKERQQVCKYVFQFGESCKTILFLQYEDIFYFIRRPFNQSHGVIFHLTTMNKVFGQDISIMHIVNNRHLIKETSFSKLTRSKIILLNNENFKTLLLLAQ
jgi:hypothetical protein